MKSKKRNIEFLKIILLLLLFFHYNTINNYSEINIDSPSELDTLIVGRNYLIEWSKTEDYPVDLFYSIDFGENWTQIASEIAQNNYSWTVPELDSLHIRFKAVASLFVPPYQTNSIINAHSNEVRSLDIDEKKELLLSSGKDARIILWNFTDRSKIGEVSYEDNGIYSAKFFSDGDSIVAAIDSSLIVFDTDQLNFQYEITAVDFHDDIRAIDVHREKQLLVAGSFDGQAAIIDLSTGAANVFSARDGERIYSVKFSRDGNFFCFGTYTGDVIVISTDDFQEVAYFESENVTGQGLVWSCDISPDNQEVVSGLISGVINELSVGDVEKMQSLDEHSGQVRVLNYHPLLDNVLFSASLDGSFLHWDLVAGETIHEKTESNGQILCGLYYADGDGIAVGTRNGDIYFWRNYQYIAEIDSVDCEIRYPLVLKIPNIYAELNQIIDIPVVKSSATIEYRFWTEFPGWNRTRLDFPTKLLYPMEEVENDATKERDTIIKTINDYAMEDTLFTLRCIVLLGDEFEGELKIIDSEFENNPAYKVFVENGLLLIDGECIGEPPIGVVRRGEELSVVMNPHPVGDKSEINMKMVEEGKHVLEIYSSEGLLLKKILESEFKETSYSFIHDFSRFSNGTYFLRLRAPSRIFDLPFIINR